jgi:hypothetical protein
VSFVFTHVPPDVTIQVVRGLDVCKFCLALCLQNLWLTSMKKLVTFGYVVGVYLPRKFKIIFFNCLRVSDTSALTHNNT